jgi:hypothetical protein
MAVAEDGRLPDGAELAGLSEPLWAIAKALGDIASEWQRGNWRADAERAREDEAERAAEHERISAAAMQAQCPHCKAAPGEDCRAANGGPVEGWAGMHIRRFRLGGWRT